MRGDIVAMLAYEAKVKPEVADAISKIDTLSHEDIDRLTMPLPWYLVALHRMKDKLEEAARQALILNNTQYINNPDPMGWMAEWNYDDCYYQVTAAMSIEIKYGTLVWFPEDGGVWIETTFVKHLDARMAGLKPIEQMAKTRYSETYRAKINSKM
jgi:hypothetical protein